MEPKISRDVFFQYIKEKRDRATLQEVEGPPPRDSRHRNLLYYLFSFDQIEKTGNWLSWNWSAFFFGPAWLLYRKMYLEGVVVLLLELLVSITHLWLIFHIALGCFGNYLYIKSIQKRAFLGSKRKGTSLLAALPLPILFLFLSIIGIIFFWGLR